MTNHTARGPVAASPPVSRVLAESLVHAMRSIRSSPGFSALTVLTIALTVGAAVSMSSMMRRLIFEPPPFVAEPANVFKVHQVFPKDDGTSEVFAGTSYPFFQVVRRDAGGLDAVTAYRLADVPVGSTDVRLAHASLVGFGFGRVMGAPAALGRWFDDAETDPATGQRVAVLGHGLWMSQFGGRADVLSQTIAVKGQAYRIIGVAPAGFRGIEFKDVELWLPLFAQADGTIPPSRWYKVPSAFNLTLAVRAKKQVSPDSAGAEVQALYRQFLVATDGPARTQGDRDLVARHGRAGIVLAPVIGSHGDDLALRPEATLSAWLSALSIVLLLVACANVAGLQLLRAVRRRDDVSVMLALGAAPSRIVLQRLIEGLVLVATGVGAAAVLTAAGNGWMQRRILASDVFVPATAGDAGLLALAFLCAAAVVCGTSVISLAAYFRSRPSGTAVTSVRPFLRTRSNGVQAALAFQSAMTVVLLLGAALMGKSLFLALTEDIGWSRQSALVQLDVTGTGRQPAEIGRFLETALPSIRSLPGVAHAALSSDGPLRSASVVGDLSAPGRVLPRLASGGPYVNLVTPGFFEAAGMRLVEGRGFSETDRLSGAIVVNQTLAKVYWPRESAIGQCLVRDCGPCLPVVGVVADTRRFRLGEADHYGCYYVALAPLSDAARVLIVRSAGDDATVQSAVRRALLDLGPPSKNVRFQSIGEALEPQLRRWRLGSVLFGTFATVAVLLAMLGLFAAVAYEVTARRRELATRVALGARPATLVTMLLAELIRRSALATALGLLAGYLAGPMLQDLLYRVQPHDGFAFAAAATLAMVIPVAASLMPVLRASHASPAADLRSS